ncbi:uncharacterized protein LOC125039652 isoform X2 [Penaeus chinensis]|uniref:uncharacterized protein LOC125039652 isoform X2 n=1 Tax=Penaeus chinensis TaxID=139456 RepID=UPI001FB83B74|nr:uncharacterized protein LOC125039652 isoform X2 [Penaeus chinensis]
METARAPSVRMWSVVENPLGKPACSLRWVESRVSEMPSAMSVVGRITPSASVTSASSATRIWPILPQRENASLDREGEYIHHYENCKRSG